MVKETPGVARDDYLKLYRKGWLPTPELLCAVDVTARLYLLWMFGNNRSARWTAAIAYPKDFACPSSTSEV